MKFQTNNLNNINSFQEGEVDYKDMIPPLAQNQGDFSGLNNNQNFDMENLNSMMKNLNLENYRNNFFPMNNNSNQVQNDVLGNEENPLNNPNLGNINFDMIQNNMNNFNNQGNQGNKKKTKVN